MRSLSFSTLVATLTLVKTTAVVHALSSLFDRARQDIVSQDVPDSSVGSVNGDDGLVKPTWKLSEKAIWWLHFPKCGSSFGYSAAACTRAPGRRPTLHQVVPRNVTVQDLAYVAVMVRRPRQRLASARSWMRMALQEDFPCCIGDWGWRPAVYRAAREQIARNESLGQVMGRFGGCQTNMILGYGCMSGRSHTESDIEEAKRRIHLFGFVGLVERWSESMCLFNFFVTGERFVMDFQLGNYRTSLSNNGLDEYDVEDLQPDISDRVIYKDAAKRFETQLWRHNISRETCPVRKLPDDMSPPELHLDHVHGVEPPEER
eukprot:TRINITY_DN29676_c0_g1_i1.p1 TRINITY_DN29676_c0_g1~~TRINITY_DN29676_c0_g1_i1.p1  ORF type:complete len:317 (+),score=38.29 TRINITY_DN29676_c0_g1_i1:82-1032(+)